jgi:Cu/Ag efflux pump CusA
VLRNLTEGIVPVVIVLFLFLENARGALIVTLTIPFSLLFASICLDLRTFRPTFFRWARWTSAWSWMVQS